MASLITAALAILTVAGSTVAQGDPEALTGTKYNQATKSWQQWQPKPTYALNQVPDQYMGANRIPTGGEPQTGFNRCAVDAWNQKSLCQTAWLNDVNDWCIWGPPDGGEIGVTERVAVAYCTTDKHGTRLIPDGTLTSVHFLQTPNYVQVTGTGDFTSIGIPQGDAGGEMDPHGADDLGNPIGGILFTTANPASNGQPWQVREWTNFMSWDMYCIRACWGDQAAQHCEHIYDVLGCRWNMPSESGYTAGIFESCDGDDAPLQGIFNGSTFRQGEAVTPSAHAPAPSSNCQAQSSQRHGLFAVSGVSPSPPSSSSSTSSTSSTSSASTSSSTSSSTVASSSTTSAAAASSSAASASGSAATASRAGATSNSSNAANNAAGAAFHLGSKVALASTIGVTALAAFVALL